MVGRVGLVPDNSSETEIGETETGDRIGKPMSYYLPILLYYYFVWNIMQSCAALCEINSFLKKP